MNYNNVIFYGRSLHQPEYKIMQLGFNKGLSNTQIGAIFLMQDEMKKKCDGIEIFFNEYSGKCKGNVDAVFLDDVSLIPDLIR